jgi:hypothetical protein
LLNTNRCDYLAEREGIIKVECELVKYQLRNRYSEENCGFLAIGGGARWLLREAEKALDG